MAKQRRKYERLLDVARDTYRADHAVMRATADDVRKVLDRHKSLSVTDPYGRHGAKRLVCTMCTTSPYPCQTWKSLNATLEKLQSRLT